MGVELRGLWFGGLSNSGKCRDVPKPLKIGGMYFKVILGILSIIY